MGLLDMFKPQLEAPEHKIVRIDPQTDELINQDIKLAQQTPEQIAAQRLQGVDQAAKSGQQNDQQMTQQQASLGYASPGMNRAIRNQYNSQAGSEVDRLKNAYQQSATFEKSAMLQQGFAEAQARQNVTMQSYARLMDAYNQTESARAQMLSSILGAGGAFAGTYAGMQHGKSSRRPGAPGAGPGYGENASTAYEQNMEANSPGNFSPGGYMSTGSQGGYGNIG